MTATTTTTIQGVSVHSRQKKHGTDVFELGLSHAGIEIRRPGRPIQQLSWSRVSEWEIEERKGYVLLTLRGRGATTPLIVPGWSLDDLEVLMREVTSDAMTYEPEGPGPLVNDVDGNGAVPTAVAAAAAAPAARPKTRQKTRQKTRPKPARPPAAAATTAVPATTTSAAAPPETAESMAAAVAPVARPTPIEAPAPPRQPAPSRAERRQTTRQWRALRLFPATWKAVVTVALLGVLATAVTLVLLQSAGLISWSFLGPIA